MTVHGHRRAYVRAGSGPALLLLHGLGCDHTTWEPVIDVAGARRYTVIAPDLLGHGSSDKPRADYSVGGYANGMRDLLTVLGHRHGRPWSGHSFGGGVAMQFAYQFPERTERLVLVASGGLGPEVTPAIRAITTPGFHQVMGVLDAARHPPRRHGGLRAARRAPASRQPATSTRSPTSTTRSGTRARGPRSAHVVRAVVDWQGQIVTMADRAYLTEAMPMCVVWGADDLVIPVGHAEQRQRPRADGPRRDHPQRRPLPAQGPPGAVREDRARLHPLHRAGALRPRALARAARGRARRPPARAEAGEPPRRPEPAARRAKPA